MAGTSQDDIKNDVNEGGEPTGEDTPQETELDSAKKALAESQAREKRYKEQVSGSQTEAERLKARVEELESQSQKTEELSPELSSEDKEYRAYLAKLGMMPKSEVEKMIQDRVAPFQAKEQARGKSEQKRILDEFVRGKPDLQEDKDPEGIKMQKIISRLKRIAPADPFDPNLGLKDDLELAYKWALEEETNKEALLKARAEGRAEGHEASETQVGEGASTSSTSSKVQRTPEQEEVMREWGVDDATISKQTEKKE